jgi:hypothetical protein
MKYAHLCDFRTFHTRRDLATRSLSSAASTVYGLTGHDCSTAICSRAGLPAHRLFAASDSFHRKEYCTEKDRAKRSVAWKRWPHSVVDRYVSGHPLCANIMTVLLETNFMEVQEVRLTLSEHTQASDACSLSETFAEVAA